MMFLCMVILAMVSRLTPIILITADLQCNENEVPFPHNVCKPFDDCYEEAYNFLYANLPSWDRSNADSLGFHNSTGAEVDGLDDGVATLGINISLAAKQKYFWAGNVSEDVYYEYVVTFSHVNEARNNWRPYLTQVVEKIIKDHLDIEDTSLDMEDVVKVVNTNLWVKHYLGNDVVFRSSQTPLIYDPMSTIVYGYASCTGVSILLADALRAAGVPVRLAGTPAWNGEISHGNHNWIEVYDHRSLQWHFIEATPAGGGESLADPCDKWFCNPDKMTGGTQFFAARWKFEEERTVYPMAWDRGNTEVPGVNRTSYYQTVCNSC